MIERFEAARQGYRFDYTSEKATMRLADFLDVYRERPDLYLIDVDLPDALAPDLGEHPLMKGFEAMEGYHARTAFYIGAGGSLTELHYEYEDLVHVVIDGEKEWFLFDPVDFDRLYPETDPEGPDFSRLDVARPESSPRAADATLYSVKMRAGDILYLPCYWWHAVRSRGRNVALSYKRTDRRSQIRAYLKLLRSGQFGPEGIALVDGWPRRMQDAPALLDAVRRNGAAAFSDDLVERYLQYGSAHESLSRSGRPVDWLCDIFDAAAPTVTERLRQSRCPDSVIYLLETFYRVRTGRFLTEPDDPPHP